jgi:hypothetical protein
LCAPHFNEAKAFGQRPQLSPAPASISKNKPTTQRTPHSNGDAKSKSSTIPNEWRKTNPIWSKQSVEIFPKRAKIFLNDESLNGFGFNIRRGKHTFCI